MRWPQRAPRRQRDVRGDVERLSACERAIGQQQAARLVLPPDTGLGHLHRLVRRGNQPTAEPTHHDVLLQDLDWSGRIVERPGGVDQIGIGEGPRGAVEVAQPAQPPIAPDGGVDREHLHIRPVHQSGADVDERAQHGAVVVDGLAGVDDGCLPSAGEERPEEYSAQCAHRCACCGGGQGRRGGGASASEPTVARRAVQRPQHRHGGHCCRQPGAGEHDAVAVDAECSGEDEHHRRGHQRLGPSEGPKRERVGRQGHQAQRQGRNRGERTGAGHRGHRGGELGPDEPEVEADVLPRGACGKSETHAAAVEDQAEHLGQHDGGQHDGHHPWEPDLAEQEADEVHHQCHGEHGAQVLPAGEHSRQTERGDDSERRQ
jgi:hypothetical protein